MADSARDPAALERDLDRTREELARTIDEIVDRVHPKRVAQRRVELFRANAQHFRDTVGAKIGVDGARGVRPRERLREPGHGGETRSGEAGAYSADVSEGYLGSTTYAVRRATVPLLAGAGVLAVATAVVVWRLRRR